MIRNRVFSIEEDNIFLIFVKVEIGDTACLRVVIKTRALIVEVIAIDVSEL